MKRLKLLFSWLYKLNHWEGCERLTIWDYAYKRRIGVSTAWRLAKVITDTLKQQIQTI